MVFRASIAMYDRPPGLSAADVCGARAADQVSPPYERRRQSARALSGNSPGLQSSDPITGTSDLLENSASSSAAPRFRAKIHTLDLPPTSSPNEKSAKCVDTESAQV